MTTRIKHIPRPMRNLNGYWKHPQMPDFLGAPASDFNKWIVEHDLELRLVNMCDDPAAKSCWATYILPDIELKQAALNAWKPTPPNADPWFLLAIAEGEVGPVAYWAQDMFPEEDTRTEEQKMGLPRLPPADFTTGFERPVWTQPTMVNYAISAQLLQAAPVVEQLNEELHTQRRRFENLQSAVGVLIPDDDELLADKYYIAAFNHTLDGYMMWVSPSQQGYTPDIATAGLFDKDEAWKQRDDSGGQLVPVPVPFLKTLRVRRVVDLGDSQNAWCATASDLGNAIVEFNERLNGGL